MQKLLLTLLSLTITFSLSAQQTYKEMMDDMSVNFYDVVRAAEAHFEANGTGKGSGYKGYQRWKNENESKYYPTGDRSQVDPHFAEKAYQAFLDNNPQAPERRSFTRWVDLGPYDANNVTSHYSPGIGRVEAFYVDPADPQNIYMGSRSGGFWRTTNEGQTWLNTTDFLFASGVNTITASPTNSDSVLINVRNARNGATHGIYRSVNGGLAWTATAFVPANLGWGGLGTNHQINKVVYHPRVPNLIFVGTNRGIFRSTDNLATWTQLYSGSDIRDIEFHPTDNDIIYFFDNRNSRRAFFISYNQGLTYGATTDAPGAGNDEAFLSVSTDCESCVYYGKDGGVWLYDLLSGTWRFLSNPDESCDGFAVSDLDTTFMVYGYVNIEASSNGGQTFTEVCNWVRANNPPNAYVHADLRIAECVNGVFYLGTDGYLAKSTTNGITWTILNDGTGIRENYGVAISQSNWKMNMCGSQDNGTSVTNENGWIEWNGGDGMHAVIQPLNDDWMIGSWQYGTRNRTTDGAQTRRTKSTPDDRGDWEAPILLDPNEQMRVYSFKDSLWVTENFAENWQLVSNPLNANIREAAIAYNNSQLIVIARNADIRLSEDGGANFSSIASGLPGHAIKDIEFAPNNDSTIVVVYDRHQNDGNKVYITHDLGQTWDNITSNLGNMPLRAVAIDHTDAANIYVGGEIGVYMKPMNSTTWSLYSPGLPNTSIQDLEVHMGANILRAATWGRGLWEYTLANRNDFPRILFTDITDPPTYDTPKEGIEQYITSVIAYDDNLTDVFVKYSANAPVFDQVLSMSNTEDSTWVSDTGLPGFAEGTKVYFKVYAVGSRQDTTLTHKFMYTVREFDYCDAIGAPNTTSDWIDFVKLKEIENRSGKDAYGDFTNQYATLYTDSSYTLQIDLNFHWEPDTSGAWIDFNQNAVFDASEFIEMSMFNANHESFGTVTVPTDAVIDTVRMRVRSQYYNQQPVPCGENTGEVEDYSIIIMKGPNVSIEEDLFAQQIKVYPNPNTGLFQLEVPAGTQANYEIHDVVGKIIAKGRVLQAKTQLNITETTPGVYFLHLLTEGERYVKKIVKE
jgi:photosystem II stability/assembly factor-like uncharacterized protein